MWQIRIEKSFQKSFRFLDQTAQARVTMFLEEIQNGLPDPLRQSNFRKLQGCFNFGRFRLGNYRIGVSIEPSEKILRLRFVGKRGDFYKNFPPA